MADWARDKLPTIPSEVVAEKIPVPMPMKMRKEYGIVSTLPLIEIDNPLYGYEFGQNTTDEVLLMGTKRTERYGKVQTDKTLAQKQTTADERYNNMKKVMTPWTAEATSKLKPEGNLAERVVYLLQAYNDFGMVSHNKYDPSRVEKQPDNIFKEGQFDPKTSGEGYGSIEDIHNVIHGLVGGMGEYDGHMAQVEIASFDPLFWLHHCNIDRLFSIWLALHYDSAEEKTYVIDKPVGESNWGRSVGETEGMDSPLIPFYKTQTDFWTAADVRDSTNLGYAYPETKEWEYKGDYMKYRENILKSLSENYSNASLANIISNAAQGKPAGKKSEDTLRKRGHALAAVRANKYPDDVDNFVSVLAGGADFKVKGDEDRSLKALATNNTYFEYMLNIKAEKHALDGQYGMHIFIGPVEEEVTAKWILSPTHVGTFKPLGQPPDTRCAKCQVDQAANELVTSQIPLTIALVERYFAGFLKDLEIDSVVEHLQKHLHWEVVAADGTWLKKRRDLVSGLKVSVSSNEVTIALQPGELPKYDDAIVTLTKITTNLQGKGRAEGTGFTADDYEFKVALES